ncbi:MAG: replicative DNA helicase [Bacteroidota bacterium]
MADNVRPFRYEPQPLGNTACEAGIITALLIDNSLLKAYCGRLAPADFTDEFHGFVFAWISELVTAGRLADAACLQPVIADKTIGSVSGAEYLNLLAKVEAPSKDKLAGYVAEVVRYAGQRQLINAAQRLSVSAQAKDAKLNDLVATTTRDFEAALIKARSANDTSRSSSEAISDVITIMRQPDRPRALRTGLAALDGLIGGLEPGHFVILAGRPGSGKTMTALQIALNVSRLPNHAVGYVSLEMADTEIAHRVLSNLSWEAEPERGIPYARIVNGDPRDADTLERIAQRHTPFDILDKSGLSVPEIVAWTQDLQRRRALTGRTLKLLVVDYLGLLRPSLTYRGNRVQEVSEISLGLKNAARELGIPILALHQLNRSVESRDNKRPLLADLRDSGSLEQDADKVIFTYYEAYYLRQKEDDVQAEAAREERHRQLEHNLELIVSKNRQGPTGTASVGVWMDCNVVIDKKRA